MDALIDVLKMLVANVFSHFAVDWLKKIFEAFQAPQVSQMRP